MKIRAALTEGAGKLKAVNPESPFLDAAILLAFVLNTEKDKVYAMLPDELDALHYDEFKLLLARRIEGESVAYIVGKKEFFGRLFAVNHHVLVPRPDSELLVELAIEFVSSLPKKSNIFAHDAFTGSGCIGISVAAECPDVKITCSDICNDAVLIAKQNAEKITDTKPGYIIPDIVPGDILSSSDNELDFITANPPYVSSAWTEKMQNEGCKEPILALLAGEDGLKFYTPLAKQAYSKLRIGGALFAEIGEEQGNSVSDIFLENGFSRVLVHKDLSGQARVVSGVKI